MIGHHPMSCQAFLGTWQKKSMSSICPMKATEYAPGVARNMMMDKIGFSGNDVVSCFPNENLNFGRDIQIPE